MARSGSYDNLVTLLSVVLVLSAVGFASEMTKRYAAESTSAFKASAIIESNSVKGYIKPGSNRSKLEVNIPAENLQVTLSPAQANQLKDRFDKAVALLHAKQYDYAIQALNQVIKLQPKMPDAYVNLGYAYLGLGRHETALYAFNKATELKPDQVNAYYGMAIALESQKELEGALGAMRTFIHLSDPANPFLAKARSALWEWEAQLGRIPGVVEAPPGTKSPLIIKNSPHKLGSKP